MSADRAAVTESDASRRLYGIEAGRGVAASLVVLYHVSRHLDRSLGAPLLRGVFQFGHAGVDFFFVISGFVILFAHYSDVGNPARVTRYVERRAIRLMPTYWVALALTISIHAMGSQGAPSLAELAWSASLLPSNHEMILGVAWTLQFEILFYALICILIASRPVGLSVFVAWFSLTILATAIPLDAIGLPNQFYGAYNLEFFLGMAIAYTLKNYRIPRCQSVWVTGLVLFGAAAVLEDLRFMDGEGNYARLAYGIPAALIVLGIAEADRQNLLRVPAMLRALGGASYSIYLFQFIFIAPVWQLLLGIRLAQRMPIIVAFLVLSGAAVVGGVLTSVWVEYPLMRLVRGWRGAFRLRPKAPKAG